MFATHASRRRGIAYAVLLAISLLLLAFSNTPPVVELRRASGFALSPIQEWLSGVTRTGLSVFDTLAQIDQLRQRNRTLEERNQELEVENRRLEEIRVQNEQLARLLQVGSSVGYDTVAAEVISRGISQNERVITINQGSDRGIEERDIVVAGGAALVGQVVEVGPNFSRVMLINDTRSIVIGLIGTSRTSGEVRGRLAQTLEMTKIPSTDRVVLEDIVVTAGLDLGASVRSPFPKGLLIGRVIGVDRDPTEVVQTAFIAPAAPLDKLEYVLVITNFEGADPVSPAPTRSPAPASRSPSPRATRSP